MDLLTLEEEVVMWKQDLEMQEAEEANAVDKLLEELEMEVAKRALQVRQWGMGL